MVFHRQRLLSACTGLSSINVTPYLTHIYVMTIKHVLQATAMPEIVVPYLVPFSSLDHMRLKRITS